MVGFHESHLLDGFVLVGNLHKGVKGEVCFRVFRPMSHSRKVDELEIVEHPVKRLNIRNNGS